MIQAKDINKNIQYNYIQFIKLYQIIFIFHKIQYKFQVDSIIFQMILLNNWVSLVIAILLGNKHFYWEIYIFMAQFNYK